jgi:hypothetical protein
MRLMFTIEDKEKEKNKKKTLNNEEKSPACLRGMS